MAGADMSCAFRGGLALSDKPPDQGEVKPYRNRAAPTHKRVPADVGVFGESCSNSMLGLSRFSSSQKLFKGEFKGPIERALNPFGDLWINRTRPNKDIPVMTSSCWGIVKRARPELMDALAGADAAGSEAKNYAAFKQSASSLYHYDETVSKIAPKMPAFSELKRIFDRLGIERKFIGYAVVNFEGGLFGGEYARIPEDSFVHKPPESLHPRDRVMFRDNPPLDASGPVYDIRKQEVRDLIAAELLRNMIANGVDAVLIDYAVRPFAFGLPSLAGAMPPGWFEKAQDHQYYLMRTIYHKLRAAGRELFLNGVMLDGIVATDPDLSKAFLKCCDGIFWEQPFRWEWRTYNDGQHNYYERLQQFFDVTAKLRKMLFIKSGTYRFHATEDLEPSWIARYDKTDYGVERHLAQYLTSFYLLYYDRRFSCLLHTHPTEMFDIFCSEAYFDIWSAKLGEPLGCRVQLDTHVHMRSFENGDVYLNNQLESVEISGLVPGDRLVRPLAKITLQALSGTFVPAAKTPQNYLIIGKYRAARLLRRLESVGKKLLKKSAAR